MKSPHAILDFTQQSWFANAKQIQKLQADVSSACTSLGIVHIDQCELFLDQQQLTIKTNAALATRIRQIQPDLHAFLTLKGWPIAEIKLLVVRHAQALNAHLVQAKWINPNLARYGKRTTPNEVQKTLLLKHMTQTAKPSLLKS